MPEDFRSTIAQYRAGLEAEMALLRQVEALSEREREVTLSGDLAAVAEIADARDRVMANLVTIEYELRPLRLTLLELRDRLEDAPEFQEVVSIHREAADRVAAILTSDRTSLAALQDAERARRAALQALDKGESTLAAYRRVIAPTPTGATLVNRRG